MDLADFVRLLPKAELHCHLEGAVRVETFVELAGKNGIKLPPYQDPAELYTNYRTFQEFEALYRTVGRSLFARDDFQRVAYETLQEASRCGVRYREMFWSPSDHLNAGVEYADALGGIIDGIHAARSDFGIDCRMIADIDRSRSPEEACEVVRLVIDNRRDELIGIGLDYDERGNPPEKFWKAYRQARAAGLHRTAHAGEFGGHARNIETCLDLLECERIDHGYRLLDDENLVRRCERAGTLFTTVPTAHKPALLDDKGIVHWDRHPIKEMTRRGLRITLNSDDPAIMKTDPAKAYEHAAIYLGFGPEHFKAVILESISGSWLDTSTKQLWRKEWSEEIDGLICKFDQLGVTPASSPIPGDSSHPRVDGRSG